LKEKLAEPVILDAKIMRVLTVYSQLPLENAVLENYMRLIPTEITLKLGNSSEVAWPTRDKFYWLRHADELEHWSASNFKEPSLVYVRFEIHYNIDSRAPATGITLGNEACVSLCVASNEPNTPVDVIQRTTIHELGHLAQNLTGNREGLDGTNHCQHPQCLMNSTSGDHATFDSVCEAIRRRSTECCSKCEGVRRRAFIEENPLSDTPSPPA
jgi:hypothetical protein